MTPNELPRVVLNRLQSLDRRPARDAAGLFRLDGVRPAVQAFDAGLAFEQVVYCKKLLRNELAQMLVHRLGRRGVARLAVPPDLYRGIHREERASGLIAVARQPWRRLGELSPHAGLCWVCVESIRSPGNLGTLLRTASAVGAAGLIVLQTPGSAVDVFDPASVRASMGGLMHLKLARAVPDELSAWVGRAGGGMVAVTGDAPPAWSAPLPRRPRVLMLGEERHGLSAAARSLCTHAASLPMPGYADSLNVAVAGGAMLYELLRRQAAADLGRQASQLPAPAARNASAAPAASGRLK